MNQAILLGVSGCIAAYKAAEIVRRFQDRDFRVQVIMTDHARQFVGPLTFQALSGQRVITGLFDPSGSPQIEHIALTQNHDLLLVAPATANILGKFARGIADDFLSTIYLSFTGKVVLAPGMNVEMWNHPAVRENAEILQRRGVLFVDPEEGYLACGSVGAGRMADPSKIVQFCAQLLDVRRDLEGVRLLITAGPTVEDLDPVRFLTNRSSGKMGYALAERAAARGASVWLVSGPVSLAVPPGVHRTTVRSTAEMRAAVLQQFPESDLVIMAAAVCDYTVREVSAQKLKKSREGMILQLVATPDILEELAARKKNQLIVGFAAESQNLLENARHKLLAKRADLIVANDISLPDSGLESDFNTVTLLDCGGRIVPYPRMSKPEVADAILDLLAERLSSCRKQ